MQNTNETDILNNQPVTVDITSNDKLINTSQTTDNFDDKIEMGIGDLFVHARNIRLMPNSRISRGEYLIANTPFSIITVLLSILAYKSLGLSVYGIITVILAVVSIVMGIRLSVARFHDLNKSGRNLLWIYIPIFMVIAIFVGLFNLIVATQGQFLNGTNIALSLIVLLLVIIAVILLIIVIIFYIKLFFYKGTVGDNKYGTNPLLHQPTSNINYWLIYLSIFIITVILSQNFLPQSDSLKNFGGMGEIGSMLDSGMQNVMPNNNLPIINDDAIVDTRGIIVTNDSGNILTP